MTPRTSRECEKENRALAMYVAAANWGWMSENHPPQAAQEIPFYLTSPFIEPAKSNGKSNGKSKMRGDDYPVSSG